MFHIHHSTTVINNFPTFVLYLYLLESLKLWELKNNFITNKGLFNVCQTFNKLLENNPVLGQLRIWPKMRGFCLIVGCLVFWTYILNDTGLEVNVFQPWKALAMRLCVFYQDPWLEGEEKGVFCVPSLPVIIFIMNLSLSFRQLGPVPIWRDLPWTSATSHAWLFPEITWLEIQSFFFF